MKALIHTVRPGARHSERGVTMILVAVAMVAIIAMAALSIDVVTLYLAREEAQRAADAAALASAKVISLSGVTSDPNNSSGQWPSICGGSTSPATQTAASVAKQSTVGSAAATTVDCNVLCRRGQFGKLHWFAVRNRCQQSDGHRASRPQQLAYVFFEDVGKNRKLGERLRDCRSV